MARTDQVVGGPIRRPVNMSQDLDGSIHNDAVASELGFRGGTVAGSIHLELFPPLLLEVFDPGWFERGSLSIGFRNATTDREPVRAFVERPDRDSHSQVRAWIEREDGMLVGEGTAAAGSPTDAPALQQIDIHRFEPGELRILAGVAEGDEIPEAEVRMAANWQLDRLDSIAEPLDIYSASSWGGPVASPATLVQYLYEHPARVLGSLATGSAVGLFGAIEIRHVNGPLVLDRTYRVGGEVIAVGQSPKTEYVWFESYADAGEVRVAEMRMQLRWMKASSPLYDA